MTDMKLIYYSTAYFASHGGSNHSKQFFREAKADIRVKEMLLFPPQAANQTVLRAPKQLGLRSLLRGVGVFQIVFFHRRNKFHIDRLIHFIKKEKPDAIVIRLDSNFFQINKLKRLFPSLIIATEINASPFDESFRNIAFRRLYQSMERRSLSLADFNFFVSDSLRNAIMKNKLSARRDLVAHNGVDPSLFSPNIQRSSRMRFGYSNSDFVLGYIGTLDHHKRVDVLLHSLQQLTEHFENVRLLVVGSGEELHSLKSLATALKVEAFVTFAGGRPHDEIPGYINAFDLAIHHKASEYMSPLKIFEYMACGVPVIGPDTSAVREVFRDNVHLILCDGTPNNLTSHIRALVERPERRRELADAGRRLVTEQYTWRANADLIISKILSKRSP